MQKLNFPGTAWRGLALIGTQKKTPDLIDRVSRSSSSLLECRWSSWWTFGPLQS